VERAILLRKSSLQLSQQIMDGSKMGKFTKMPKQIITISDCPTKTHDACEVEFRDSLGLGYQIVCNCKCHKKGLGPQPPSQKQWSQNQTGSSQLLWENKNDHQKE
jgi:hypothetical protein